MEDQEAILQLKKGNPAGLEVLVKKYQHQAFRTANLIVRDPPLAEDIVQSCFLKAFKSIHLFNSERSFSPWFLKIVVNDAIKTAKMEQKLVSIDNDTSANILSRLNDSNPGPEELLEDIQTKEDLLEALAHLSPEQRAAIVMRYFLELGEAEMSEVLERPPGTIKWRLHKARETLRGILIRKSGK